MAQQQAKFVLDESRIPRAWYNIVADLPVKPPPGLHPGTGQPLGPADLAPLFGYFGFRLNDPLFDRILEVCRANIPGVTE